MQEYSELKLFFSDVLEWKETSMAILNDWKNEKYIYDIIRKHIQEGEKLELEDEDLDLMKSLIEMTAHWKNMARKVLKTRTIIKFENEEYPVLLNSAKSLKYRFNREQNVD